MPYYDRLLNVSYYHISTILRQWQYCYSTIKLAGVHISQRVLVPLHSRRPLSLTHQPLLISCYGQSVNGGECDHPLPLLAVEVVGRHPAGPVLLVPQPVQLGQELLLDPHFPGSSHILDVVDGVNGVTLLTILLVEATAAAKEEPVLVLHGVKGEYWFMRSPEADAGVAATALGMLTLTVSLALLSSWNGGNDDNPRPALWWQSLWLDFISCARGALDLDPAKVINIVGEGGQGREGGQGGDGG